MELIRSALKNINLACVIDHSGRAGNAFFLTIFDQHPNVLACPLMHYTYSYIVTAFKQNEISASEAKTFLTQKSYFRLLYDPLNDENAKLIYRMGMCGSDVICYQKIRGYCDDFFDNCQSIHRKELVLLPFIFYALAHNRNIQDIKYVLVSDAISLRSETVNTGYSGKIIDIIIEDFPNAKLFSLVRDPRATFASPRHQFVNGLGNMYALKPGNFLSRLTDFWKKNLQMDNSCVFLFWLLYLAQSAKTIDKKKKQYANSFYLVRNEDLNRDFLATITKICDWLEVRWHSSKNADFTPTILGTPWQGTGAYNSRYQTVTNGRLANDSDSLAQKAIGPNSYVTQRWQQRLNKREIRLIERLFKDEMLCYGYPILFDNSHDSDFKNYIRAALLPFEGELPSLSWLANGFKESFLEVFYRFYYCIAFIPFYISARIILVDYIFRKKLFKSTLSSV